MMAALVSKAVDEMLHLKIANALLDHDPPQTLILRDWRRKGVRFWNELSSAGGASTKKARLEPCRRSPNPWTEQLSNAFRTLSQRPIRRDSVSNRSTTTIQRSRSSLPASMKWRRVASCTWQIAP